MRGRGENREPLDLLVTDGVAIARLRHGTLRGRTNRHGFRCCASSVHSSSHRYFRNQLEAAQHEVHLCASDPCTAPDEEAFHIFASAVVPRSTDVDLQGEAGRGPLRRCAVATRFWGCHCRPITWVRKSCISLWACLCCGCRKRSRLRPPGTNSTRDGASRHDESETERKQKKKNPAKPTELPTSLTAPSNLFVKDPVVTWPLGLKCGFYLRTKPAVAGMSSNQKMAPPGSQPATTIELYMRIRLTSVGVSSTGATRRPRLERVDLGCASCIPPRRKNLRPAEPPPKRWWTLPLPSWKAPACLMDPQVPRHVSCPGLLRDQWR